MLLREDAFAVYDKKRFLMCTSDRQNTSLIPGCRRFSGFRSLPGKGCSVCIGGISGADAQGGARGFPAHVALKVLAATSLVDPKQVLRFEREARAAARLHHTNIVPDFGVGEHEGTAYYVMQFIPGLGLDVVLDDLRRLQQANIRPGWIDPPVGDDGNERRLADAPAASRSVARA